MARIALTMLAVLLSACIWWRFGISWAALAAWGLTLTLLTLAAIDIRMRLLPDNLTQPLLWAGLLINLRGTFTSLEHAVIGAALGYFLLWLVASFYFHCRHQHGLGSGDVKLMAALGAWLGWEALPGLLIIASLSGTIGALLLAWKKQQAPLYTAIPFGPFLAAAGMLNLFFPDWLNAHGAGFVLR